MIFFTADEHYGHTNIIKFCNRPFKDADEMDLEMIKRNNEIVGPDDTVYHIGDFCFRSALSPQTYINVLNGSHKFIKGSHDKWMEGPLMWEGDINKQKIVLCHYAMRSWRWSFHGSWQLHGHSHGRLEPIGKQIDVGVDTNDFYPYSWDQIVKIMEKRGDNID